MKKTNLISAEVFSDASKVCMTNTQIGIADIISTPANGFPSAMGFLAQNNSEVCIHGLGSSPTSDPTFINNGNPHILADNSTLKCYNVLTSVFGYPFIRVVNTKNHRFDIANNRSNGGGLGTPAIDVEKGTSGGSSIKGNTITNSNIFSWLSDKCTRVTSNCSQGQVGLFRDTPPNKKQ